MNRRHPVGVLVVYLSVAAFGAVAAVATAGMSGCSDNPVGRLCDLGASTPAMNASAIASPSLDCVTRTCLRFKPTRPPPPGANPQPLNNGLCTAECSADSDCDRVPESPCVTGFTCAIAVTAGDFCCQKLCICKDYILLPSTGQPETPAACDPMIHDNACCNLPGRINSPDPLYSLCKG
jgi:hypothetical protein